MHGTSPRHDADLALQINGREEPTKVDGKQKDSGLIEVETHKSRPAVIGWIAPSDSSLKSKEKASETMCNGQVRLETGCEERSEVKEAVDWSGI